MKKVINQDDIQIPSWRHQGGRLEEIGETSATHFRSHLLTFLSSGLVEVCILFSNSKMVCTQLFDHTEKWSVNL